MRNILLTFAAATMLAAPPGAMAQAESFTVGDLNYSIEEGVVSVADNYSAQGDIVIPETVTYNGQDYPVTRISDWAFNWAPITSVSIPSSVTWIGDQAFCGSQITAIDIPASVTHLGWLAFGNCNGLTYVNVPATITECGESAFQGCENLESISVELTEIPNNFASNCWKLANVYFSGNTEKIGNGAFSGGQVPIKELWLPYTLKYIGAGAFNGAQLTSLTIPPSVTYIGGSAFACNYAHLTELRFEDGEEPLEIDPSGAFWVTPAEKIYLGRNLSQKLDCDMMYLTTLETGGGCTRLDGFDIGCYALQNVILHEGLEIIGKSSLSMLDKLQSLTIPSTVKTIEEYALNILYNLTDLTFADGEEPLTLEQGCLGIVEPLHCYVGREMTGTDTWIGGQRMVDLTFGGGCRTITRQWSGKSALKTVTIGEGVTRIEEAGLQNNGELTTVFTPSTLTYIGNDAFNYCQKLAYCPIPDAVTYIGDTSFQSTLIGEVNLPEGLTYLGGWSFAGCNNIKSVTIPSTLEEIQWCAFHQCTGITELTIPPTVKFIDTSAFGGCTSMKKLTLADSDEGLRLSSMGVFIGSPIEELYLGRLVHGSHFTPTNLSKIEFGGGCKTVIGFDEAEALKNITFGPEVTQIAEKCFAKATAISEVTSQALTAPELVADAFAENVYADAILNVPYAVVMDYNADPSWTLFAHMPGMKFDLTIDATEGGRIEVDGTSDIPATAESMKSPSLAIKAAVDKSATPTVSVTADEGYEIVSITVDGADIKLDNPATAEFTLSPMLGPVAVSVAFSPLVSLDTLNADASGIEVEGLTLSIPGYDGPMAVYTLAGAAVYNGPATTVTVPSAGLYIVRTTAGAAKVAVP